MAQPQLSGKVSQEIKDRFIALRGKSSFSEFIESLLNALENQGENNQPPQIPEGYISPEAHAEAIQLKENEIGRLKTAAGLHEDEVRRLKETIRLEISNHADLRNEIENQPPAEIKPSENQLLIEVNPFVLFAIDDEIAARKKRFNVDDAPGQLLSDYFLHMKKYGKVEPVYLWTEREFNQHQKRFEIPAADE